MTELRDLTLYATPEHDCSYLPGKQATTLFADPKIKVDTHLYSQLSELGFRRSGQHYYRPHCEHCQACTPIRVSAQHFKPSKSQKRVLKKNANVRGQLIPADFHEDHYLIYEKYILNRHADGDMYPPSREQFRSFLVNGHHSTQFLELTENDQLLAVAVCDQLEDGLSAIYTFFDPDYSSRSMGTLAVLWQLQEAKRLNLNYLYLGYYIRECRKMSYKTQFSPFEARLDNHWFTEAQLEEIAAQHQKKD